MCCSVATKHYPTDVGSNPRPGKSSSLFALFAFPHCFSRLIIVVRSDVAFLSRFRDVDVVDASVFFHLSSERLVFGWDISSLTRV
jgi:hypothetical protein